MLCREDIDPETWQNGTMLSNKGLQIRFSYALLVFEFWVADKVPQWLGHLLVTSASPVALIFQLKIHQNPWKSFICTKISVLRLYCFCSKIPWEVQTGRVWPCLRNFRTDLPWSSVLILWFNMFFLLPPEPQDTRYRRWPIFSLHLLPSCKANRGYNRFEWSTSQHILSTSSKQH